MQFISTVHTYGALPHTPQPLLKEGDPSPVGMVDPKTNFIFSVSHAERGENLVYNLFCRILPGKGIEGGKGLFYAHCNRV